jgi:hypothetical protein
LSSFAEGGGPAVAVVTSPLHGPGPLFLLGRFKKAVFVRNLCPPFVPNLLGDFLKLALVIALFVVEYNPHSPDGVP